VSSAGAVSADTLAPPLPPPVSRVLFDAALPLEAETTLNVAADHGRPVRAVAAAEAHRASVLRAQIDRLEAAYALVTAPDGRTKRRLTRAALATRRDPVPDWATPGGAY